jgi:1-aminocyclopropane-1-carboxylate deaminase/D-cysteine desulfhydrase-like pyridoxal-dependent ACC family enzyme
VQASFTCVESRAAEARLRALFADRVRLAHWPTPVHELPALAQALGARVRLFVKRDDLATFGFGGSKIRGLELLAAQARAEHADLLVTVGGMQSNCTRLTAAAAARLGMSCAVVVNGDAESPPTVNLRLCQMLGAQITSVATREDRAPAAARIIEHARQRGQRPFEIPVSAATPMSALAMTMALLETLDVHPAPDAIVVCSSSGATQAGLLLGAALRGLALRVIGVSPDDPAAEIVPRIARFLDSMADRIGLPRQLIADRPIDVDDRFIPGSACDRPSACEHVMQLTARTEGLFVDPIYTCRPVAALVDALQHDLLSHVHSILFWHTGGLPGLLSR